jgi:hypothetical protein
VDEARLLGAIAAIEIAMGQQRERDQAKHKLRINAIRSMAERMAATHAERLRGLTTRINTKLLPVDPLRQSWNVFRLFELEHDEARWMQWLASILRAENGAWCARVAWSAFCDAAGRRVDDTSDWENAATDVPEIEDDAAGLTITCANLVAVRVAADDIVWRDLGQALRRALAREWSDDPNTVIELWPIILTLVSIEQDLLDLELAPTHRVLPKLAELAAYLEER